MRERRARSLVAGSAGAAASRCIHGPDGQPVVAEFSAQKAGGSWISLGRNFTPEFQVTTGKRRFSEQQMVPLLMLAIQPTPEVVEHEKWSAFWDALSRPL